MELLELWSLLSLLWPGTATSNKAEANKIDTSQLFSDGCNTVEDLVWVQPLQPGSATISRAPLLVGRLLMFCQK